MRILIYIYTLFFALVTVSGEVGINKNGRMYNTIGSNKLKINKFSFVNHSENITLWKYCDTL